ncbi:MAG: hypothetical protein AMXMBFR13_36600 [Phycisphaerae bacterium]
MTLVEVLVASILLGVGVVGLLSAATMGMRNQQRTEQRAAAMWLAQEKMAEIDRMGAHVWMLAQPDNGSEPRGDVVFNWTTQIEQHSVGELFTVQVEVSWSVPGGGGSVQVATLLNDYEAKALTAPEQRDRAGPNTANRGESS